MQKRASKPKGGIYPVSFKIKAIKRVERGEGVLPVARDIGVTRKALHEWIRAWNAMGVEGLNRKRGRKPGRLKLRAVAMRFSPFHHYGPPHKIPDSPMGPPSALSGIGL